MEGSVSTEVHCTCTEPAAGMLLFSEGVVIRIALARQAQMPSKESCMRILLCKTKISFGGSPGIKRRYLQLGRTGDNELK